MGVDGNLQTVGRYLRLRNGHWQRHLRSGDGAPAGVHCGQGLAPCESSRGVAGATAEVPGLRDDQGALLDTASAGAPALRSVPPSAPHPAVAMVAVMARANGKRRKTRDRTADERLPDSFCEESGDMGSAPDLQTYESRRARSGGPNERVGYHLLDSGLMTLRAGGEVRSTGMASSAAV